MPIVKTDRASIIKESIHLFKVHGYYSTTMANIGDACGLIKGSIYHHFKSKEALALACLEHIHSLFTEDIFSIAYQDHWSPEKKLILFTKEVETYFLNSEGGCLLGNFALEVSNNISVLRTEIIDYFKDWENAVYTILEPRLGEEVGRKKAVQLVSNTQGSIMLMRLYGTTDAFDIQNHEALQLLNSGDLPHGLF